MKAKLFYLYLFLITCFVLIITGCPPAEQTPEPTAEPTAEPTVEPSQDLLIDNCEDGDLVNELNGIWSANDDSGDDGNSIINPLPLVMTQGDGAPGSTSYCVGYTYTLKADDQWRFVGIQTTLYPESSVNTLLFEDFEGTSTVNASDGDGTANGEYYWAKSGYRPYRGDYSLWAVGGGENGSALGPGSNYPDNCLSNVVYGPYDLSTAQNIEVYFRYWLNSESSCDHLYAKYSIAGDTFYPTYNASGDSSEWSGNPSTGWYGVLTLNRNFKNLILGEPQVWFMFSFESNDTTNYPEGAYIDHISICTTPIVDISEYTGIRFYVKGSGHSQRISIRSANIRDWDSYQYEITSTPTVWTKYEIPFDDFIQAGWGEAVSRTESLQQALHIGFGTSSGVAEESGYVYYDDIELYK